MDDIPPPEDSSRRKLVGIVLAFQVFTLWSYAAIKIATRLVV